MSNRILISIFSLATVVLVSTASAHNPSLECRITPEERLITAATKGDMEEMNLLLDICKVDINYADVIGKTPLMWAVRGGQVAMVKELLKRPGIRVNQGDNNGETAFMALIYSNSKDWREMATDLINAKASVLPRTYSGTTALTFAADSRTAALEKSKFIIQNLPEWIQGGYLINYVNAPEITGKNALFWAKGEANSELVAYLESLGAKMPTGPIVSH